MAKVLLRGLVSVFSNNFNNLGCTAVGVGPFFPHVARIIADMSNFILDYFSGQNSSVGSILSNVLLL